jgi:hypothetical protein
MHHPFDFLEAIPPWDIVSWTETWQDVRVYFVKHNPEVDVHHEGIISSPLEVVRVLKEFEVWTNWEKYEQGQPGKYTRTWRFTLRRDILDSYGRQRLLYSIFGENLLGTLGEFGTKSSAC